MGGEVGVGGEKTKVTAKAIFYQFFKMAQQIKTVLNDVNISEKPLQLPVRLTLFSTPSPFGSTPLRGQDHTGSFGPVAEAPRNCRGCGQRLPRFKIVHQLRFLLRHEAANLMAGLELTGLQENFS